MPAPSRPTRQPSQHDISIANNTVNQFLGGKRKSWMVDADDTQATTPVATTTAATRTSPRKLNQLQEAALERAARKETTTVNAATTLPSPTPTQEPTPPLTTTQPVRPPLGYKNSASNTTPVTPTATSNGANGAGAHPASMQAQGGQPGQPYNSAQAAYYQRQRPILPVQAPSVNNLVYSRPYAANQQQTNKRRRAAAANSPTLAQFTPILEGFLNECRAQGHAHTQPEQKRFYFLAEACRTNDYYYVAFHQILCLWFKDREFLLKIAQLGQNVKVLDAGLCHMTSFLIATKAAPVRAEYGRWYTTFPADFEQLVNYSDAYKTAVVDVTRSLVAMVQNIPAFLQQCIQRRYAPMVEEICQTFFIASPVVQKLMFVWVRNEMSIPDDQFANLMMDEFIRGQNWHTQLSKRINTAYPPTQREINESANYTKAQYLALRDAQVKHYASNIAVQLSARVSKPQSPVVQAPSAALNALCGPASVSSNHNANGSDSPVLASPSLAQQQLAARGQPTRGPPGVTSLREGAMASMQSPSPVVANMPSPAIQPGQFVVATTSSSRQESFSRPIQQQNGMMTPHMNGAPQFHPTQQNQLIPNQQQTMPNIATPQHYELMRRGHQFQQQQPTLPQSQTRYQMANPLAGPYTPNPQQQQQGGPEKPAFWHPANVSARTPHLPNPDVMALHYADLRSPTLKPVDRVMQQKGKPDDRYYQVVKRIVVGPAILRSQFYDQFVFELEKDSQEKLPTHKKIRPTDPDLREIKHGSCLYRIRCVKLAEGKNLISDSEFVVTDITWPPNITIEIAGKKEEDAKSLSMRRKNQWGKDLPIDITRHISDHYEGKEKEEKVKINVVVSKISGKEKYAFGIEEIEVVRHDITVKECLGRTLDSKTTEDGIKKMLNPSTTADDDDIVMGPSDLNISLQDPWLAKLWNTPVKGQYCLHRECFDLDTFLETRPKTRREKSIIFHDQDTDNAVVSAADVWKCPLCGADARPVKLRVDEWMQGVKTKLLEDGKAHEARTIVVRPDASWKVRDEEARKVNMVAEREKEKKQAEEKKNDIVVIDLDDD